jgi:hypothetical protein
LEALRRLLIADEVDASVAKQFLTNVPAPFSYLSLKEDKWDSENLKD